MGEEASFVAKPNKPHVVCVPFPMQGHIIPMLRLAKLLHYRGFYVTFVNTEHNNKRVLDSRGGNSLNNIIPDFCFRTLPDFDQTPPNSHASLALSLFALRQSCRKYFPTSFGKLLSRLNDDANASSNVPPVTCVISDAMLSDLVVVAEQQGIPTVLLCIIAASGFLSFKDSRDQLRKSFALLQGDQSKENLDATLDWIPGFKGARLGDVLSFVKSMGPEALGNDSSEGELEKVSKASAIVFHTFDALEKDVLLGLPSTWKKVYSIGPFQLLQGHIPGDNYKPIECSLWNQKPECIEWLNSKEPSSVIYVNFGSVAVMSMEEVVELGWGLANSGQNFLWIIRPDLVMGDNAILAQEFLEEIKERGLLASWCQQEEVLNHPSIAGFITHCGWNSIIESISSGVPLICCPSFGDQMVNAKNCCNEWGIGLQLDNNQFERGHVEKLVRELTEGERGKRMKDKAIEWQTLAKEAASPGGSSFLNFDELVNEVLLKY